LLRGDGAVTWRVGPGTGDLVIGLSTEDIDASVRDVAFGLRARSGTREIEVLEAGVVRAAVGTWTAGDRLGLATRDGVVEYTRNGVLLWTSSSAPAYPLVVDAAFAGPGRVTARLTGVLGRAVEWTGAAGVRARSTVAAAAGRAVLVERAGTMAGAVEAVLEGAAGIGLARGSAAGAAPSIPDTDGATLSSGNAAAGCWFCATRLGDDRAVVSSLGAGGAAASTPPAMRLRIVHAGEVRGTWEAPEGVRVRVEITPGGTIRYLAGATLLDEAPAGDAGPLGAAAAFGEAGGRVRLATAEPPRR
jgi:hypothetical protein